VKVFISRLVVSFALVAVATTGTACGKRSSVGGIVSGAQFSTIEENGNVFGKLDLLLQTGNVLLPAFDLPILNPKNPGAIYGTISMQDALSAGTRLGISVNLTEISGVEGVDGSLLPNGRSIPLFLGEGVKPIAVSIRNNSRAYFAFSAGTAVIGTAIVIPEFDKISSSVGAVDVFFPFQASNGVSGVAGLFSSNQSGQSGIAVFVDASSAMKAIPEKSMNRALASVAAKGTSQNGSSVGFRSQNGMSSMQTYRLHQFLSKLGDRGRRLRLQ
jgi:hypothetical protein